MKKTTFTCALLILIFNVDTMAHSIRFGVNQEPPAVIVQAAFSKTAPLVDASVEIFSPGNESPYQKGSTDKQGYFSFLPNEAGTWKVSVDDGMGHYDMITISISGEFFTQEEIIIASDPEPQQMTHDAIPVIYKILFGLALIFGLTGIMYGIKAGKLAKA